jgi:2,4-dienoyl-CoA reductase-like NADH-dependent reductase (Old Yellow Enzyme family)/thioredoxin reductase
MTDRYAHVFNPIKLGPVEIKNRFYFSPHGIPYSVAGGPSDTFAHYYAARAAGGVGLTIHSVSVMPRRAGLGITPYLAETLPSFEATARLVHEAGAKIFAQIHYSRVGNGWMYEPGSSIAPLFAPSPVQVFDDFHVTHEMSVETIRKVVDAHRVSARNLAAAGYDGIEVHCSHAMLVEAFLSPYFNRRTDEYGGSVDKRMRFLIECLEAARDGAGSKLAVGMRYNADEMMPGGLTQDDTRDVLARVVSMGLLDFVDIDIALEPNQFPLGMPTYLIPKHLYAGFVGGIRDAAADVPVLSVIARVTSIAEAEQFIGEGLVDMVGTARGLMAEPDLVRNATAGQEEDSRTCTSCNICMSYSARGTWGCAINPETGREKLWSTYLPAAHPGMVVVAGGGPAGLEAARVSALKGHRVVLLERSQRLGGQLRLWARLPGREIFDTTPDWYERQLAKLGVDVHLGVDATPEGILAERPNAVIVATGSRYLRTGESGFMEHEIPGWDQSWIYTPEQIIEGGVRPTGKVLILDEEGINTAAGIAEMLAEGGAQVTMLTRWLQPLQHMVGTLEFALELPRLKSLGVTLMPMTFIKELGNHTATIFDVFTNAETDIDDVSAVVMATGRRADLGLARALDGKVAQLFSVGDAMAPRGLTEAIHEGHRYARLLGEEGAPSNFTELFFSPIDYDAFQKPASVLSQPVVAR